MAISVTEKIVSRWVSPRYDIVYSMLLPIGEPIISHGEFKRFDEFSSLGGGMLRRFRRAQISL